MKIELTEDLDAETGLLMTKRSGDEEGEDAVDDECGGDEDEDGGEDDIICDNYLPTPLRNSGEKLYVYLSDYPLSVCRS